MLNILIVDDSNDKIADIVSVISEIPEKVNIDTVIDVISAQLKTKEIKYDLMIVDLMLPFRKGDEPTKDGGKILLSEIERQKGLLSPKYIIGMTQYSSYLDNFSELWKCLLYSPSESMWRDTLKRLIKHIIISNDAEISQDDDVKPTLFVEGESDKEIILAALSIFKPERHEKIKVKTSKSAGAKWVSNQIIAWAHLLQKNTDSYVQAIGLFDGDQAGIDAKQEINRIIKPSSAQAKTYSTLSLSPTYAKEIRKLYQNGVIIPITLEEMFNPSYWQVANLKGWLEKRNQSDITLKDPKNWDKLNMSLLEHLKGLGLSEEEEIYLNKFKLESKEDFCKYILALPDDEKKLSLHNFEDLVNEICLKLKVV